MELFPYQKAGAQFMAERKASYNADRPGLGKSAQAITAALQRGAKSARVVCPASVRENWRREFVKFGGAGIHLDIHSYEGAAKLEQLKTTDVLIVDEAHYIKTRTAKRTEALLGAKASGSGLMAKSAATMFLSGTPTPNNPAEIWPVLHAAFPDAIALRSGRTMDYWSFVDKFCQTRDNGFGIQIVGGKNLEELRQRISPYFIRRRKEDVLPQLPEMLYGTLTLESANVVGELKALESEWAAPIADALAQGGIDGLAKLGPHIARLRRLTGLAKVKPAFNFVLESLANGVDKIILFAYHTDVIDGLVKLFKEQNLETAVITGATPPNQRQGQVDRFQNQAEVRVFIGQITAAGTGITLTAASNLLMVESSWTPAENQQAIMRIHRVGQSRACLAQFVSLAGSVDESIAEACRRKADVSEQLGF